MSSVVATQPQIDPADVERAEERDGTLYELIDGDLKEKKVGFLALWIAGQIVTRLNARFYPKDGIAAAEVMVYCFADKRRGRKPDVVYVSIARLPNGVIPEGDLHVAPDLVVEVLSPNNTAFEVNRKLLEYLEAKIALIWIVNPELRTIEVIRQNGTFKFFSADETIENEPTLPGFSMLVGDVFPAVTVNPI